ncbi:MULTISPECIES: glycosyltransferase family 4 protein [Segatella]|jgi:glycosyltransferase involved in cell wall biosynthesis|uniref:Glycosyl transferase n=1 Tax=Segatella bryantii TaxID=77095 RepID=A0AA37MDH2_SEGBR|nr:MULTISPECIES: glycosyltransferase family 4 protein [Segatella]UKK78269.1 glycosyltransferase family 4 protein [Segatella baroniae B14]GJG27430.1 glycosyl transferase [Segatella bryantii]SDZ99589.1 Glycosyltransferase involved in cell wall bisynthesis [Segatella bryantii]SEP71161.1 Glycosyltransferase involved in cell wall bisynthesis [Segatella baroniae B14]
MKKKLIRLTTVDLSLDKLIPGQLKYMSSVFDVIGVASDTGLLDKVRKREGVRMVNIPMEREVSLLKDLRSLIALFFFFRKEKPDILHCNTPKGSLLALLAGLFAGVPNRIYLVTGLRYQGTTGFFRFILKTMERISCFCATQVIPEGHGVLHTLHADHITNKRLRVLHYGNINGIDTSYFSRKCLEENFRSALGFTDDDFVFIFVGRIVRDKGMNELAEAMKKLISEKRSKQVKLLLVGSFEKGNPLYGDNEDFLRNSEHVKFVGWQEDVRPYLAAADALVFPSYREGFPNVPIQAGALDIPCIVTNINGCNEIIKDNLNGKIIRAPYAQQGKRDSLMENALYETMKWFIEHPEEVKRMGRNARGMITSRYEQKDVWKEILNLYLELVGLNNN